MITFLWIWPGTSNWPIQALMPRALRLCYAVRLALPNAKSLRAKTVNCRSACRLSGSSGRQIEIVLISRPEEDSKQPVCAKHTPKFSEAEERNEHNEHQRR